MDSASSLMARRAACSHEGHSGDADTGVEGFGKSMRNKQPEIGHVVYIMMPKLDGDAC